MTTNKIKAYYVEPVGGHSGMHYYDFEICEELAKKGIDVVLHTCDETQKPYASEKFEVRIPFKKIYGSTWKLRRGIRYIKGMFRVIKEARKNKAHILHLHFFHCPPLDFAFLLIARLLGMNIVITVHDVIPFDTHPLDVIWIKKIYRSADALIVHTRDSQRLLTNTLNIPGHKIRIIPQGPYLKFSAQQQLSKSKARTKLSLPQGAYIVLFFGQIKKVKGLNYLIKALPELLEKAPESILVIAGAEWKDSFTAYQNLIKELHLEDNVIAHIRYIPDQDVPVYFTAADVVVLPYIQVFQSAVLFMAYSFAKPIIASRVGGLSEVIKNGETGILVPPKDEKALAQALIKVYYQKQWSEALGRKGKLVVQEKYSWTSIAGNTADVYHSLVFKKMQGS